MHAHATTFAFTRSGPATAAKVTGVRVEWYLRVRIRKMDLFAPGTSTTVAVSEREPLAIVTVSVVEAVKFVLVVMTPFESIANAEALMVKSYGAGKVVSALSAQTWPTNRACAAVELPQQPT